jgi:hypothetical protein
MLYMVVPRGQSLGPLNGPNCIPKNPPVGTAWGTFDGAFPLPQTRRRQVCLRLARSPQQTLSSTHRVVSTSVRAVQGHPHQAPSRAFVRPPPARGARLRQARRLAPTRGEDVTDGLAYRMWHLRRLHTGQRYHRHLREPGGGRAGCLLVS